MSATAPQTKSSAPDFFARSVRVARRYYLDLTPPAAVDLAVVCGGYEECAPNYRVKRDTFPYFVVEWVVRGKGSVVLDGNRHDLGKDSLFCFGPETVHDIQTDSSRPLAKHFVSFVGSESLDLLEQAGLLPGSVERLPPRLDFAWIFESLRRDGETGDRFSEAACKTLLRYLLVKLASTPSTPKSEDAGAHATFVRCDEYLVENAKQLASLAELADDCGVDEAYLCRLYRRFSSETPYQRLRRLKMNLAADDLLATQSSIKQVALAFGFSDPFHFSRTFKSVFGVAPSEFRRLH